MQGTAISAESSAQSLSDAKSTTSLERKDKVTTSEVLLRDETDPAMLAIQKRVLLKTDLVICSMMCVIYALQYLLKICNSPSTMMGLREDLNMKGGMYSWVGASFYFGYLVFNLPLSFLQQKLPLVKTTGVFITLWGVVVACSAASNGYASYLTTRIILGGLESSVTPAFVMMTAQWYKRHEHYSRTCIWFGFTGVGVIMANSIGYGILKRLEHWPMAGWRIYHLIIGVVTAAVGVLFFFIIPENPQKAWFLNAQEKEAQAQRVKDNDTSFESHGIKWYQIREACLDIKTWVTFAITVLLLIQNGGVTNFDSILISSFIGNDQPRTLLMGIITGAVLTVGSVGVGVCSTYMFQNRRYIYGLGGGILNIATLTLLSWGPGNKVRLAALFLTVMLISPPYMSLLSYVSSNVCGHTKKTFVNCVLLIGYCVGNIIGPFTFKESEAPDYGTGKISMLLTTCAGFACLGLLVVLNMLSNKKRDARGEKLAEGLDMKRDDLTDWENPEFRYVL